MRFGVSEDVVPRVAQVFYRLDHQADNEPWNFFWLPLLADDSIHSYTYDLKLLSLPANARIIGIRLDPVVNGLPDGKNLVQIEQIGFLHEPNSKIGGCDT